MNETNGSSKSRDSLRKRSNRSLTQTHSSHLSICADYNVANTAPAAARERHQRRKTRDSKPDSYLNLHRVYQNVLDRKKNVKKNAKSLSDADFFHTELYNSQRKQSDRFEHLEQTECATTCNSSARKYICRNSTQIHTNVEPISEISFPTEKSGLKFSISSKSYDSFITNSNPFVAGNAPATESSYHRSQSLLDKIYHPIYTSPIVRLTPNQAYQPKPYRHYIKVLEMESINPDSDISMKGNYGASKGPSPIVMASITRQKKFIAKVKFIALAACAIAFFVGAVSIVSIHDVEENDEVQKSPNFEKTRQRALSSAQYNISLASNSIGDLEESTIKNLRHEFEEWIKDHTKHYESEEVKENRFKIWVSNHLRTQKKNELHGPCKMTRQPVFGSNHFKDLHPDEFQAKFLTGYKGPVTEKLLERRTLRSDQRQHMKPHGRPVVSDVVTSDGMNDPKTAMNRHPSVQERYTKHLESTPPMGKKYIENWNERKSSNCGYQKTYVKRDRNYGCNSNRYKSSFQAAMTSTVADCEWYNLSCWFRWLFSQGYRHIGKTREPSYNANNYPQAIDWRELGAVTSVHSQGSCGACWAITAVETIESANYIKTGQLLDLSETEVIACDDTCIMCDGGWPQNAYEYASKHKGLPLESTLQYDDEFLAILSQVTTGQSDELTENEVDNYLSSVCPADQGGSHSGSADNGEYDNSSPRYGAVKGYAYATDRCICYEDGTGCDCDEQNEMLAVRNIASYGPATVCLDASTWQDYTGGIITAESGCSQEFLDMNHCVQVVGYAYYDIYEEEEENQQEQRNSKSGSGSKDQADNGKRQGYWIVRNQWSDYWGMYGYSYVAMGENTCGILNDITQVFME